MRMLLRLGFISIVLALLNGCDSGGGGDGQAHLRLLNVSPGYDSLDLYANGEDADEDVLRVASVTYDTVSDYTAVDSGRYTIKFKRNAVTSTLQTLSSKDLTDDTHRLFVSFGSTSQFGVLELAEDESEPDSGLTKVQLLNVAEAGGLDVYLTESSVSLDDASPTYAGVGSGAGGSLTTIDNGDYRLRITGASDTDDLRLDVPNISFGSKQIITLVLTATEGGVLVNALVLPQGGGVTKYASTKARVRGAVGIANGTTVSARVGEVSVLNNSGVGVIGNYAQVDAGNLTVSVSVNGAAATVPTQTFAAGGEYTLLVWNNADGTQTTLLSDDNRLPGAGDAKVRVLNGLSALNVPVTLAVDFSPVAEGIVLGQASAFEEVDGGAEYQLDVSNSETAQILLSRSSVSLQAGGVYTMLLSGSGTSVAGTLRKDR